MTRLAPMSAAEFAAYFEALIPDYAMDKVTAGQWTPDESQARSAAEVASLLPAGQATPGHHFRVIEDASGQTVGLIWFAAEEQGGQKIAYVYDIRIFPEARRKGHARRAFRALEGLVQELGLAGIGLHVFGHNAAAHALYVELGYRPTGINLFKALGPPLPN